tara:strand:- start:1123 stop:1623 length:501 start_codon:yes stop_codon:yes gene_type:complete
MDVKKQEYMLQHDKNIGKLWTERYQSQQKVEQPKIVEKPLSKCNLRQRFWQPNKPSYYVVTENKHYNLNVDGISPKFYKLVDQVKTEVILGHQSGWKLNRYSSENLLFQLLTMYQYDKLKCATLVYNNRHISYRYPSSNSKDGQVGSWLWDREYRDIPFSIWEEFE